MTDEEVAKLALDISLDDVAEDTQPGDGLVLTVQDSEELSMNVIIEQGDITQCFNDDGPRSAIVNAANVVLLGGGGVDGCIHRAAGPELKAACEKIPIVKGTREVRCPTGNAKITDGFNLPADHVIHTVGPIFETEKPVNIQEGRILLQTAITNCLIQAETYGIERIAFPAISCGVFGCPIWLFAETLYNVLSTTDWSMTEVRVVLFQDTEFAEFNKTWPGNK